MSTWSGRRILAAAALLHLLLATALFAVGRAEIAPRLVDRDGIFAEPRADSHLYRVEAVQLAETWRMRGTVAWARSTARPHVRLLSVSVTVLGPYVGEGVLAAEMVNLPCYLAIIALTLLIGREVGGRHVGLVAAGAVAVWPTFLLHTAQLLKDPLFIAGGLALILVVTTWLTRTYRARDAIAAAVAILVAATLLLLVRSKFVSVVGALVLGGLALLVTRQIAERRMLRWNVACALSIVAIGAGFLARDTRTLEKRKPYPSTYIGRSKSMTDVADAKPARIAWRAATDDVGPLMRAADRGAAALGSVRGRYNTKNGRAGSGIDDGVELQRAVDVARYVPRAAQIGLWAPFPELWLGTGAQVGRAGRLVAGAETMVIYLCEALALVAVARGPRRLPALLLLGTTVLGVTMLGLVVSNVGTLYRFRYMFWIFLVILGATGAEKIAASRRAR